MKSQRGVTLIELIIIIVVLALLAGVGLPIFIDFSSDAKISASKGSLGTIRAAIATSYASSAITGSTPAYPSSVTAGMFADRTVPDNPVSAATSRNSVSTVTGNSANPADDSTGWWYNSGTGEARLNTAGNDKNNKSWASY